MARTSHKEKGYLDELQYQRIEWEFRRKEIERNARNQDRNPTATERGMIKALRDLSRKAKELQDA